VTGEYPEPRPWWVGIVEKMVSATLLLAVAVPVKLKTGNNYIAFGAGFAALTAVNIAYWRLYQRVPLYRVYKGLKPWVGTADSDDKEDSS